MIYLCDYYRHLICFPYSIEGLHKMAEDLEISRHWYHKGNYPHYDIPKKRISEIKEKCSLVTTREIVRIIKESL